MLVPIAHAATESAGGIAALGLDWKALLFQVINFSLLLLILRIFAYRPVLKVLETRRQRVEESLRSAAEIARAKTELERQVQQTVQEAQHQAQKIMKSGQARAETIVKEAEERARQAAHQIEQQTKARLAQELATARQRLKQEVLTLVAVATERILGERLDTERDEALVAEAVASAEQHVQGKRP